MNGQLLSLGVSIGDSRVVSLLGAGVQSEVYLLKSERGRCSALRAYLPGTTTEGAVRKYVEAGYLASRALGYSVVEFVDGLGFPAAKVPFFGGQMLETFVGKGCAVHWELAEKIMDMLAQQLAQAHRAGVVHGGLKPTNIFLNFGLSGLKSVGITDFGGYYLSSVQEVTVADDALQYSAPDPKPSAAGDMFALGLVIYRLLVGRPPRLSERGRTSLRSELAPITRDRPRLCELVVNLLSDDPKQRPRAVEVAQEPDEPEETTRFVPRSRRSSQSKAKPQIDVGEPTTMLPAHSVKAVDESTKIVSSPSEDSRGYTVTSLRPEGLKARPKQGLAAHLLILNIALVVLVVLALVVLALVS